MKKQFFLVLFAFLMLHIVACGQEKKPVMEQNKVHDPVIGMTKGIEIGTNNSTEWNDSNSIYTDKNTNNLFILNYVEHIFAIHCEKKNK